MRKISLIVFMFTMVSCNEHSLNSKHIMVKGSIVDSLSGAPISNSKITILCWYHTNWNKTDYVSIDTIADKNGYFTANFDEGYKLTIAGVASNYYRNLNSIDVGKNNDIAINLKLLPRKDTSENSDTFNSLKYYIIENSSN